MTSRVMSPPGDAVTPNAAIIFVNSPADVPILTFAVARRETDDVCGTAMWEVVTKTAKTPIRAPQRPKEPWVASRPEIGLEQHSEALPALRVFERAMAWAWLTTLDLMDAEQRLKKFQAEFPGRLERPPPEPQSASARDQYELLRQVATEDALDGLPPFPRLPADLDNPAALDEWTRAWNEWVTNEAVGRQHHWLRPMTTEALKEWVLVERELRESAARLQERQDLEAVRNALNELERKLIATDPMFQQKRALLVPLLKPLFNDSLPPARWVKAFESAYAAVRLPEEVPSETRLNGAESTSERLPISDRDVDAKPLEWRRLQHIEKECATYWARDIDQHHRAYVEQEMDQRILPELRERALTDGLTEPQYHDTVAVAWLNAKTLFSALHFNVHETWPRYEERPKFFWFHQDLSSSHQGLSVLRLGDKERGFAISNDELVRAAAHYLKHPEVRANHFDWLYLDTLVFSAFETVAEHVVIRGMGTRTNWAAVYARGNEWRYLYLLMLLGVLRFAAAYLSGPAAAYWLYRQGNDVAAAWTLGLWGAAVIFSWTTYPLRRRIRRKGQRLLTHLLELNRMLGDKTISPRKLREKIDAATADGIAFDGAVMAIVDRMVARDPAAFLHLI